MNSRVAQLLELPLEGSYDKAMSIFKDLRIEASKRLVNEIDKRGMTKQEFADHVNVPISMVYHSIQQGFPFRETFEYIINVSHNFLGTSCHEFLFNSNDVCILPPEEAVLAYMMEKLNSQHLNSALFYAKDSMKEAERDGGVLTNRSENYCIYYRGKQLAKELCISPTYLTGKNTTRNFKVILRFLLEPYKPSDCSVKKNLLNYNTLMYLALFTQKTVDFYIDWKFVEYNKVGYYPITCYDCAYKFTHEVEQINKPLFLSKIEEELNELFYCRSLVDFRKKFDFSPDLKDFSPKDPLKNFLPVVMTYHYACNQEPHIISSWKVLSILQILMVLDEAHRDKLFWRLFCLYLEQLTSTTPD